MITRQSIQKGFTLIELMIVVALIGILASVAIPAYSDYTQRTRLAAAVASAQSFKTYVSDCISANGATGPCVAGAEGIPNNVGLGVLSNVNAITVAADGIITVVSSGITAGNVPMEIIFTPEIRGSALQWNMSGNGCDLAATPNPRGIKCISLP